MHSVGIARDQVECLEGDTIGTRDRSVERLLHHRALRIVERGGQQIAGLAGTERTAGEREPRRIGPGNEMMVAVKCEDHEEGNGAVNVGAEPRRVDGEIEIDADELIEQLMLERVLEKVRHFRPKEHLGPHGARSHRSVRI